jgi:uncharacterized cupredoxin-like copper-binding protein
LATVPRSTLHASAERRRRTVLAGALIGGLALACDPVVTAPTPAVEPGSSAAPREVNLIARDYRFVPEVLDLVPGETVQLHLINAGLVVHEAIIGDAATQDAWETAEAAVAGAPPGPTPVVSVAPEVAGTRLVVASGERVDLTWTVPAEVTDWFVGCHIAGHLEKGMQIPIRWVRR